jgi:hypothetical protein
LAQASLPEGEYLNVVSLTLCSSFAVAGLGDMAVYIMKKKELTQIYKD